MDATEEMNCQTVNAAARRGALERMVTLIESGHPVDAMDNRGWRPTHEAANGAHLQCLKHLLENAKTDVNWRSFDQCTALLLASKSGHAEIVQLLLSWGADPNLPDCFQLAPILAAVRSTSLECVKLLLDAEAKVDAKLYCGTTALHHAVAEGFLDMVNALLAAGAPVDCLEDYDITPVFTAAQFGQTKCLKALLEAAEKLNKVHVVNMAAEDGGTPLYLAAQEGHSGCIRLLLEYRADPNLTTNNPVSLPLHAAVQFERIRCVKQLLEVTDMNLLGECEPYIFDLAMQSSSQDCLRTLLDAQIPPDKCHRDEDPYFIPTLATFDHQMAFSQNSPALVWCAWHRYKTEHARMLLDYGACPDALSPDHMPPLLAATCKSQMDTMKLLIRNGARLDITHPSVQGNLCLIACLHNWKCLCLLLLCNARPDSIFRAKRTTSNTDPDRVQTMDFYSILFRLVMSRRQVTVGHVLYLLLNFTNSVLIDSKLRCFVEDDDQWNHLVSMTGSPSLLSHQCRLAVRNAIGPKRLCNLHPVEDLPLPEVMKDFVMFKQFDSIMNSGQILK